MYCFRYISYFFYLAFHWSVRLACFVVYHEIKGERKYGLRTTGTDDLRNSVEAAQREHSSEYQPVNFYTAEWLFAHISKANTQTTFLDMGCGKGRVLAMAAAYGFTDIIGVDFSPSLCQEAMQLCDELEEHYSNTMLSVDCEDARHYTIPTEVGVIFLFNPFDAVIMSEFLERIAESLRLLPRPLKILYANPVCKKQFLNANFEETDYFKKLGWIEASVLQWAPKA